MSIIVFERLCNNMPKFKMRVDSVDVKLDDIVGDSFICYYNFYGDIELLYNDYELSLCRYREFDVVKRRELRMSGLSNFIRNMTHRDVILYNKKIVDMLVGDPAKELVRLYLDKLYKLEVDLMVGKDGEVNEMFKKIMERNLSIQSFRVNDLYIYDKIMMNMSFSDVKNMDIEMNDNYSYDLTLLFLIASYYIYVF